MIWLKIEHPYSQQLDLVNEIALRSIGLVKDIRYVKPDYYFRFLISFDHPLSLFIRVSRRVRITYFIYFKSV